LKKKKNDASGGVMKTDSLETIELLCDTLECFIEDYLRDKNPNARCPDVHQLCIRDTEVCFPLLSVHTLTRTAERKFKKDFPKGRIERVKSDDDDTMYCAVLPRGWNVQMQSALETKQTSGKRAAKKK